MNHITEIHKLTISVNANVDMAYDTTYHRKLHGVMLNALDDTYIPNNNSEFLPLSFTGVVPWGEMTAGETRYIIVKSLNKDIIENIGESIHNSEELNIGDMHFTVTGTYYDTETVGQPGTVGRLKTDSGVLISIPPNEFDTYGISIDSTDPYYWRETDDENMFFERVKENIETKWRKQTNTESGGPHSMHGPLFTTHELQKTYALPVRLSEDHDQTVILSKWEFEYEIKTDAHRDVLNFALATGLGERNNFGLGTLSITTKQEPVLTGM